MEISCFTCALNEEARLLLSEGPPWGRGAGGWGGRRSARREFRPWGVPPGHSRAGIPLTSFLSGKFVFEKSCCCLGNQALGMAVIVPFESSWSLISEAWIGSLIFQGK